MTFYQILAQPTVVYNRLSIISTRTLQITETLQQQSQYSTSFIHFVFIGLSSIHIVHIKQAQLRVNKKHKRGPQGMGLNDRTLQSIV